MDVSDCPPVESVTAFATPKSVTTAWFCDSSTLSGLMSRCTTPWAWALVNASATSRRILRASPSGNSPSRFNLVRSDSPSM